MAKSKRASVVTNDPDLLEKLTENRPVRVSMICNFVGTKVIVEGISGETYIFENGNPVSVLTEDTPELLKRKKTYTPCCTGQKTELNVFSII